MFLIRGSAALFLGVAALASDVDLSRLGTYVAVYWIVAALLTLRWAAGQEAEPGRRIAIAAGALGLAAGIMVLLRKPLSELFDEGLLLDLLGASAIATGLLRLFGRFHDDQLEGMRPRKRYRIGIGALEIALGLTLIFADEGSASSIRIALGAWGLVTGTFLLLDGLWIRRVRREQERRAGS
jgi:uncharacterized membrane protein HdeD (DUF308 family)